MDDSAFNICLDLTSPSGQVENWFADVIAAKQRWERIIVQDPWPTWHRNTVATAMHGEIGTNVPFFGVDDVYVSVKVVDYLDGPGTYSK